MEVRTYVSTPPSKKKDLQGTVPPLLVPETLGETIKE